MKQFLYLDTDIVNSIIAQSDQGLIQSFTDEQVSSDTESDSSKIAADVKAQLGGSLAKLVKAEANLSGSLESVESNSSTATSREIISKTMHDAAFNIAYNHIKPTIIEYGNQKAREKVLEIAKSLLEDGTEIVKIMRATGLTEEELLNLQNELLTV